MIREKKLFSDTILNIFTDASYNNTTKIGCSGAICVLGNNIIDTRLQVISNTTSNYCELFAIILGIDLAIKYKYLEFEYINLFSDSNISLQSITGWLSRWMENIRYFPELGQYFFINSANEKVKNQDLIILIINTILRNKLYINLYHQYGHIKNTNASLKKAKNHFVQRNYIVHDIEDNLIERLSYYNNFIDNITRKYLERYGEVQNDHLMIQPIYIPFDVDVYMKLVNHKRREI